MATDTGMHHARAGKARVVCLSGRHLCAVASFHSLLEPGQLNTRPPPAEGEPWGSISLPPSRSGLSQLTTRNKGTLLNSTALAIPPPPLALAIAQLLARVRFALPEANIHSSTHPQASNAALTRPLYTDARALLTQPYPDASLSSVSRPSRLLHVVDNCKVDSSKLGTKLTPYV